MPPPGLCAPLDATGIWTGGYISTLFQFIGLGDADEELEMFMFDALSNTRWP